MLTAQAVNRGNYVQIGQIQPPVQPLPFILLAALLLLFILALLVLSAEL